MTKLIVAFRNLANALKNEFEKWHVNIATSEMNTENFLPDFFLTFPPAE